MQQKVITIIKSLIRLTILVGACAYLSACELQEQLEGKGKDMNSPSRDLNLNQNTDSSSERSSLSTLSSECSLAVGDKADEIRQEMCMIINDERAQQGLAPLVLDNNHIQAAQSHARDMAANNYLSDRGLDGSTVADRLQAAGVSFTLSAENAAKGSVGAQQIMDKLMTMQSHSRHINSSDYTKLGVGFEAGYWVQTFSN